ncbi:bacillithiol system redox-active protein YtxJ [Fodinisporobacter ferrooxydans]|uniref:Bacillithiol system redox-active protein YtxJ n=1 Tax=Fodinisporobacter ferrooxydans TaxID=2901836 RepID=A0ABY4CN68_9BACL|nr:bacillithiol system redox-active protein YtxJ [Alicyclobacillaceae bacterium MYW30-H2]
MTQWREIQSLDEWQNVLEQSTEKLVLLFKHSTTCPISANAFAECQAYIAGEPRQDVDYVLVKVIESRPVSNQIAADLQVKHESPQTVLLQNKQAVWNASHWSITKASLVDVLNGNA